MSDPVSNDRAIEVLREPFETAFAMHDDRDDAWADFEALARKALAGARANYSQVKEFTDPADWLAYRISSMMGPDGGYCTVEEACQLLFELELGKPAGRWRVVFDDGGRGDDG